MSEHQTAATDIKSSGVSQATALSRRLRELVAQYESRDAFDPYAMDAEFDDLQAKVYRNTFETERLAMEFWEAWADEAQHGFPGLYQPLHETDWPALALNIATSLETNQAVSESRILALFGSAARETRSKSVLTRIVRGPAYLQLALFLVVLTAVLLIWVVS